MTRTATDLQDLQNRFMEVNRARLDRLQELLSSRQWDLLSSLPALMTLNSEDLPGFVDAHTPCGIREYQPETEAITALSRLVTGFRYQHSVAHNLEIMSLFMMGSSGSIAFTATSDFDIWVCVDADLPEPGKLLLLQKCAKIEAWAETFGLELHFFLVDQEQFRNSGELTLSGESSGTAQRFLLLEEFYRTAILMAGLPPLWWIIPAEEESRYDQFAESLNRWPNIKPENYLDFGPLDDIPVEEFTGAGLWQVFKGIDSPYKSVMKMILMEAYIDEHPDTRLVSLDYKKKVQQGITELERLDPYLLMFEKADAYLVDTDQADRAELLRHCFYLKISDRLSQQPSLGSTRHDLRRNLMQAYVEAWGWSADKLASLDQRDQWRISQIMTETRDIHRELGNSYTQLSRLAAKKSLATAISKTDLHVLGRRIYAALERKPGKIEIVNRDQALITEEPVLYIGKAHNKNGDTVWLLYDHANPKAEQRSPLKRFATSVELLLWCWLNSITGPHTRWLANQQQTRLGERELALLNRFFKDQLPLPESLQTTTTDLAAPLRYTQLMVLVNFGYDPFAKHSRQGTRLASSRSDPLSYGDTKINTISRIDLVYCSAWGEVTAHNLYGNQTIGETLERYLTERAAHGENYPEPAFFGLSEHYGHAAEIRCESLFATAREVFTAPCEHNRRLVYMAGSGFGLIEQTDAGFNSLFLETPEALAEALGQPPPGKMITRVDTLATDIGALALITELNSLDSIQLFIQIDGKNTHFHVIDECGTYMTLSTATYELQGHLRHMHHFVENISRRLSLARQGNDEIPVTYYQLLQDSVGRWQPREVEINMDAGSKIVNILALAASSANGCQALSIIFQGDEFSSLEWGAELYQRVAEQILSHRKSGETYPAYITDIELAQPMDSELPLQSIHYFKYKKSIEQRLTAAFQTSQTSNAEPEILNKQPA